VSTASNKGPSRDGSPRPDFERPPVTEVVLGVQFDPLPLITGPRIAEFWMDRLRPEFPDAREAPALEAAMEWFGLQPNARISFTSSPFAPPNRWMFLQDRKNRLVQVQQDRFVLNWRRIAEADTYPRYESIRTAFEARLDQFLEFVASKKLGTIVPTLAELTYVNLIDQSVDVLNVASVIAPWSGTHSDSYLQSAEGVDLNIRYLIKRDDVPVGRLHVSSTEAFRRVGKELKPALQLTLTARGTPARQDMQGVLDFMDLGREQIVRGFASITTPEAHRAWGRIDGSSP
jgi:uncharacterized protein (TIGR04255 family)